MEKLLSEQLDYVTWKQQEKSMLFLCGKKDLILSPNKTWWVRVQCLWTGRPTAFWNEREHSESDSLLKSCPFWDNEEIVRVDSVRDYVTKRTDPNFKWITRLMFALCKKQTDFV